MATNIVYKLSDQTHKGDEHHRENAAAFGEGTEPGDELDSHHEKKVDVCEFAEVEK